MMNRAVLIVAALVVLLLGGGAAAYFFFFQPEEGGGAAPPPAQQQSQKAPEEKKKPQDVKELKQDNKAAASRQASNVKFEELLREGNDQLLREPMKADQLFQEALQQGTAPEQQLKALYGRVMVGKVTENAELEYQAAQGMLALAQADKDRANAHEALAHAQRLRQNYKEASLAYQQAAASYIKAGSTSIACTTLVESSRLLRRYLQDFAGAEQALAQAWEAVTKGALEDAEVKVLLWTLCLERADNCRLAGDGQGQVFWHREAVKYNPAWKPTADMVERQLKEGQAPASALADADDEDADEE